jgi:hypothetical protein
MDNLSTISLVVGTIIGLAGIFIGLAGVLSGYKIAKKSGSFRKIELGISLWNHSLIPDPQFEQVIYGYSIDEDAIALCILPIKIKNDGELSAKDVAIRLVIPLGLREFKGLAFKEEELLEHMDIYGRYDKSDIKRKSYKFGGFRHIDYIIPAIPPKSSAVIEEAIDITNASGMPFKTNAISKDGVPLQIEGCLNWSAQIYVKVSATDVEPLQEHFYVRSYPTQNKEELGDKIMEDETHALRKELSKIKAPKEFVSKVYAPGISKKSIVIMPKLNKVSKPKEYAAIKRSLYMEEPEKSEIWLFGNVKKK